jgi:hypothetical protein
MRPCTCTQALAELANLRFDQEIYKFLHAWVQIHHNTDFFRSGQPLQEYLTNDALRDFFLNNTHPFQKLLENELIANHLGRCAANVYFDPVSGDPLFAHAEQRIYNLARRMDSEHMHVPFRYVYANKQTDLGDIADISTYPPQSEEIRYNSGNHFASRPANGNVFNEHSKHCLAKSAGDLQVLFKRGYLEDRLQEVKTLTSAMHKAGVTQLQYFVIYSRHSPQEGHFGVSLVIMNPSNADFPKRVMVCDTLLKELPQHPRWWHHFVAEYSHVFGNSVAEIIEDLSHPLQKVNIKGDHPYRHDWDCPYYADGMANALVDLVKKDPELLLSGSLSNIHNAMREIITDYYQHDGEVKDRQEIREINRLKRWESGQLLIEHLVAGLNSKTCC